MCAKPAATEKNNQTKLDIHITNGYSNVMAWIHSNLHSLLSKYQIIPYVDGSATDNNAIKSDEMEIAENLRGNVG